VAVVVTTDGALLIARLPSCRADVASHAQISAQTWVRRGVCIHWLRRLVATRKIIQPHIHPQPPSAMLHSSHSLCLCFTTVWSSGILSSFVLEVIALYSKLWHNLVSAIKAIRGRDTARKLLGHLDPWFWPRQHQGLGKSVTVACQCLSDLRSRQAWPHRPNEVDEIYFRTAIESPKI